MSTENPARSTKLGSRHVFNEPFKNHKEDLNKINKKDTIKINLKD